MVSSSACWLIERILDNRNNEQPIILSIRAAQDVDRTLKCADEEHNTVTQEEGHIARHNQYNRIVGPRYPAKPPTDYSIT